MEEKKLNELNDETLDAVTGGASFDYNAQTGEYIVRDKDGNEIYRTHDEKIARWETLKQSWHEDSSKTAKFF